MESSQKNQYIPSQSHTSFSDVSTCRLNTPVDTPEKLVHDGGDAFDFLLNPEYNEFGIEQRIDHPAADKPDEYTLPVPITKNPGNFSLNLPSSKLSESINESPVSETGAYRRSFSQSFAYSRSYSSVVERPIFPPPENIILNKQTHSSTTLSSPSSDRIRKKIRATSPETVSKLTTSSNEDAILRLEPSSENLAKFLQDVWGMDWIRGYMTNQELEIPSEIHDFLVKLETEYVIEMKDKHNLKQDLPNQELSNFQNRISNRREIELTNRWRIYKINMYLVFLCRSWEGLVANPYDKRVFNQILMRNFQLKIPKIAHYKLLVSKMPKLYTNQRYHSEPNEFKRLAEANKRLILDSFALPPIDTLEEGDYRVHELAQDFVIARLYFTSQYNTDITHEQAMQISTVIYNGGCVSSFEESFELCAPQENFISRIHH
jgi:hypothetical protein